MKIKRVVRKLMFISGGLLLLLVLTVGALWLYKPFDEWMGFQHAAFDDEISEGMLPPDASRSFRFTSGFSDTVRWTVFSAGRGGVEQHIVEYLGIQMDELKEWPPVPGSTGEHVRSDMPPIPTPDRASWRNKGYWDLKADLQGLFARKHLPGKNIDVFYDTTNSRLYTLVVSY